MFYGIFSIICLLGSSILLGQGIHKDDVRIVLPSSIILLIGMVLGVFWIATAV